MATRFYLPSTGAAPVTVTRAAEWDGGNTTAFKAVTARINSAMNNALSFNEANSTANTDFMLVQYVSDPIAAQSISGTASGRVRAMESATAANYRSQCLIRVVSKDGTVVRGTLYAGDLTTGTTNPTSEWAASLTNRQMPRGTSVSLSPVTALDGDRIVIEIGFRAHNTTTSATGTISVGDNAATDLAADETTTAANNPWVELSQTLTFYFDAASNLDASGTQTTDAVEINVGAADVTASGTSVADATLTKQSGAVADASSTLTVDAAIDVLNDVALSATSDLATDATVLGSGSTARIYWAVFTSEAATEKLGAAAFTGNTNLDAASVVLHTTSVSFSAQGSQTSAALVTYGANSALTAQGVLASTSAAMRSAASMLDAASVAQMASTLTVVTSAGLSALSSGTVQGGRVFASSGFYDASSAMSVFGNITAYGSTAFSGLSVLASDSIMNIGGASALVGAGVLTGIPSLDLGAIIDLSGLATLVAEPYLINYIPAVKYFFRLVDKDHWYAKVEAGSWLEHIETMKWYTRHDEHVLKPYGGKPFFINIDPETVDIP